jgi:hypothetical protein
LAWEKRQAKYAGTPPESNLGQQVVCNLEEEAVQEARDQAGQQHGAAARVLYQCRAWAATVVQFGGSREHG